MIVLRSGRRWRSTWSLSTMLTSATLIWQPFVIGHGRAVGLVRLRGSRSCGGRPVAPRRHRGPVWTAPPIVVDVTWKVNRLGRGPRPRRTRTQARRTRRRSSTPKPALICGDAPSVRHEAQPRAWSSIDRARCSPPSTPRSPTRVIRWWQLKREVGFWCPFQAIRPMPPRTATPTPHPKIGWPPSCLIRPLRLHQRSRLPHLAVLVEVIRAQPWGRQRRSRCGRGASHRTAHVRHPQRTTSTTRSTRRIWGRLYFRDAMADAHALGRRTARMVIRSSH